MSDLGSDSRALLSAARAGDDPSPADRTRMRQRLAQAGVGFAIATTAASTAAAAASSSAAAGGSAGAATAATGISSFGILAAKVVTAVVLVGGVGVGTVKAVHVYEARHGGARVTMASGTTTPSTSVAERSGTPADLESPPAILVPTEPEPGAALPSTPAPVLPRDRETARLVAPAANTPPPSIRAAAVAQASTLETERRLLKDAAVALRDGDAPRSLGLLDEHAARFPDGVLSEERAAERVLALCALGRMADARADAQRFLRERPRSPLADRVRASCVGDIP